MTASNPYLETFRGRFAGIMRWPQLDTLWETLRANHEGWYIYAIGEEPPTKQASGDQVDQFIERVDKLLREEHEEDYCGIVYADEPSDPTFIKIFDPNNLGVSCGFSDNPPLPGWILSRMPPIDLPEALPQPGNRRRWWQKMFG